MAVTYVPKKATAIVAATNVATSAPSGATNGFKLPDDVGVVRTYFDYTGTVTALNVRLYLREPLATAWYRSVSTDEINALNPANGDETRDWAVGAGNEFYFVVESIAPGSGGNTVAIKGAAVDEIAGLAVPRAGQRTAAQSAPVTLPSDGPLPVLGTISGTSTLTRPADTNAYASGDEISNSTTQGSAVPWVFPNAARANGQGGWITKAVLGCSDKLNVAIPFRVHLFKTTPTMVGDNAQYSILKAEFANWVGYLDLGPLITGGSSSDGSIVDLDCRKRYVCDPAGSSLYGILLPLGAYTPLTSETFRLSLLFDRD